MNVHKVPDILVAYDEWLKLAKRMYCHGDETATAAAKCLRGEAEDALRVGPLTIVKKETLPPSGDPHDYFSMGTYWWPNPDTADGLPYVRRDGEVNPETKNTDTPVMGKMSNNVTTLSLAWYLFEDPQFAEKAVELLRVFFLDEKTKMNPHLQYGQAIPGRCEGRYIGIVDTSRLVATLIDSIGLLRRSDAMDVQTFQGLQEWFAEYLRWLLESPYGHEESEMKNNHSTCYDLQVAVCSLFTGRKDTATKILNAVPEKRIAPQIQPDGRQPHELERTRALSYSAANLNNLFSIAAVAEKLDIDLWNFETDDGRGIRRALDWLLPFWTGRKEWQYQQINPFNHEKAYSLLRRAARAYDDTTYEEALSDLPVDPDEAVRFRCNLFYPPVRKKKYPR